MPLHLWSSARYVIPLPDGHRFPIAKYALLRDRVLAERLLPPEQLHEPALASLDDLHAVHSREYVAGLIDGTLGETQMRRIGFPWSRHLVERSLRSVGGTIEAAEAALDHGVAMNLAGGTHHAFPDHGEGFCVFNDVAVAVRRLQRTRRIARAAIVDLDVHQGNGTHAVFAGDPGVATFSVHGERNYPFHKVPGTLDVELPDGTGDEAYLERLSSALPGVLAAARADLVIYLAGADPHERDRLGRLKLTFDGLARRDHLVLSACREVGLPVCVTIAGGYGADVNETVEIHTRTVRVVKGFAEAR